MNVIVTSLKMRLGAYGWAETLRRDRPREFTIPSQEARDCGTSACGFFEEEVNEGFSFVPPLKVEDLDSYLQRMGVRSERLRERLLANELPYPTEGRGLYGAGEHLDVSHPTSAVISRLLHDALTQSRTTLCSTRTKAGPSTPPLSSPRPTPRPSQRTKPQPPLRRGPAGHGRALSVIGGMRRHESGSSRRPMRRSPWTPRCGRCSSSSMPTALSPISRPLALLSRAGRATRSPSPRRHTCEADLHCLITAALTSSPHPAPRYQIRSLESLASVMASAVSSRLDLLLASRPASVRGCVIGGVGFSAALAHEVSVQLRAATDRKEGSEGRGAQVHVLVLGEDAAVRHAWDLVRQPWFRCRNLVAAWRMDINLDGFTRVGRELALQVRKWELTAHTQLGRIKAWKLTDPMDRFFRATTSKWTTFSRSAQPASDRTSGQSWLQRRRGGLLPPRALVLRRPFSLGSASTRCSSRKHTSLPPPLEIQPPLKLLLQFQLRFQRRGAQCQIWTSSCSTCSVFSPVPSPSLTTPPLSSLPHAALPRGTEGSTTQCGGPTSWS